MDTQLSAFEAFKADLREKVTKAIADGITVGPPPCYCPLGCLIRVGVPRPPAGLVVESMDLGLANLIAFIAGYDYGFEGDLSSSARPYFELGREYAREFNKKKEEADPDGEP